MKRCPVHFQRALPIALAAAIATMAGTAAAQVHSPHSYRQFKPLYRYCPPDYEHIEPAPIDPGASDRLRRGLEGRDPAARDPARSEPDTRDPGTREPGAGNQTPPTAPAAAPSPAASTVASTSSPAAPAMIGDHFGNGYRFAGGGDLSLAGGLRRVKIAENVSPMPQDRVFFNFNNFHNTVSTANDPNEIDLYRYTVGVEKTFLSGMASLEIRTPITDGLNADQSTIAGVDNEGGEFGNMTITPKVLLAGNGCYRLAGGMGVQLPTADDARLFDGGGLRTFVENNAVHLQPFLGLLLTPNSRLFAIGYMQFDIDVSGFDVEDRIEGTGNFRDPTFLYLDAQAGYWVYQSCCCSALLSGIAPVVEIHYATNLDEFDTAPGIRPDTDHVNILNITGGLRFQIGQLSTLTVSGAAPLSDDDNRQFDSELIVQFTRRF